MLTVKNLSKSFDGQKVIDDVSFTLGKRETLVVVGPSGEGKTTLLRLLSGLETPDSGTISGGSVGLVFQDFNLFPQYTVLENLTLAPQILNEKSRSAKRLLKQLGLSDKANSYPAGLSGGEKQRAAIARALMLKPDVLCLDEPTSALDPSLTNEVARIINNLKKQQTKMIIVTHDMDFCARVADRIAMMNKGKLVLQ
jgi:polar amino acid transport system ATP-binding protein